MTREKDNYNVKSHNVSVIKDIKRSFYLAFLKVKAGEVFHWWMTVDTLFLTGLAYEGQFIGEASEKEECQNSNW